MEAAARDAGSSIASAGKAAFDKARERGARYESTMEDKALEARLTGRRQIEKAEAEAKKKASEAQGVIASALEKGRDKAHEVVDKVKTAVGLAEEKAAAAAAATVDGKAQSPVAKALQQRYEKPEAKINRTVAEVLQERYTPIDKRDNTVLRGL